jgi:hypothetical protein
MFINLEKKIEEMVSDIVQAQKITFEYKGEELTKYFAKHIARESITFKFNCYYPNAKIKHIEIIKADEITELVRKNMTEPEFLMF